MSTSALAVVTNLHLPGQYDERLLGSLGLQGPYYNWNRWYLPRVGRYLELDPVTLRGRFNSRHGVDWYNYAGGNPLTRFDRFGLSYVEYNAATGTLTVYDGSGQIVGACPASNDAQQGSRGQWAAGTYDYAYHTTHPDDGRAPHFAPRGPKTRCSRGLGPRAPAPHSQRPPVLDFQDPCLL